MTSKYFALFGFLGSGVRVRGLTCFGVEVCRILGFWSYGWQHCELRVMVVWRALKLDLATGFEISGLK